MSMFGSMENLKAAQETTPVEQALPIEQPPMLERKDPAEQAGDMPPVFGRRESAEQAGDTPPKVERKEAGEITLGESVEHRAARHSLDNAIKDGNKIAIDHRVRDLAKLEAKEMSQ